MKIVDVSESYSERGGGVRTYVHHKLAAAARAGHEMVIVAPGHEDREDEVAGGRIVWVKGPRSPFDDRYGLFGRPRAVHRILDREDADVVEGSSPLGGGWAVSTWRGRAKKAFVFHTDLVAVWPETFLAPRFGFGRVDRWSRPLWSGLRRLSAGYDVTVVSGGWLGRRLEEHGVRGARVVPFGIDKQGFSPAHRDEAVRARMLADCGLPPEADLLIGVSRLDPEKRVPVMLEGFARAARQRPLGLVLFGRGAMERSIRRQIARTPGVHLAGYVGSREAMATAMASADGLLHGSAAETYGLVVAEAVCSGVPVVVPDRGGAGALAGPGYAETYAAGDPESCARGILRLLARDRGQLRSACAVAARRIGTMDEHFDRLFELYGALSGRQGSIRPPVPTRLRAAS
ncbi:MAG: glycosyltransferase [Myxococcales bacterium]|nr:glycosyltransferase [Myxococcales bacterium]